MSEERSESESEYISPSMKPDERSNLQDYKDKESANINICQDCNIEFF
jgi:hypothetical protein